MSRRSLEILCLALGAAGCAATAQAASTKFTTTQIVIDGDVNVDATALNDSGTVVGTMYANITDNPVGFVIKNGAVSVLPPPYDPNGGPYPQGIDKDGNIVGWAGRGTGEFPNLFLWQASTATYNAAYNLALNTTYSPSTYRIVNSVGIGAQGEVFYNLIWNFDASDRPEFGTPGNFKVVPLLSQYMRITSVNTRHVLAGIAFSRLGPGSVFVGNAGGYTLLKPPGAFNAAGGYINASDAVAGSYADATRLEHGFVYAAGNYTSFDMPERPSAVAVTGFSDTGRAVGVYTSAATGAQHAFLYDGSTVTAFGAFGALEQVSVAVNNHSTMVVARHFPDQKPNYESYVVTCAGAGC